MRPYHFKEACFNKPTHIRRCMRNTTTLDKPLAGLTLAIVFASVAALAIYSAESIALAATMMFCRNMP